MEASTLRWILIIIGVLILGAILFFGNPEKQRKPRASRRQARQEAERREPTIGTPPDEAEHRTEPGMKPNQGDLNIGQGELDIAQADLQSDSASANVAQASIKPKKPAAPPPEKIVTLFLLASDNNIFSGGELLQAALKTGMEFGEMNIFHRIPEGASEPVFSLANAARPGHFDREGWNTLETGGVVLFMTLPGPMNGLDAWDAMLATARRLSELLHADIEDDQHHPFTRQREAQIREDVRDYERRKTRLDY
jgi:cell division protein ZipA